MESVEWECIVSRYCIDLKYLIISCKYLLKSYILRIGPSEIREFRRHIDSEIAPVPWFDLIIIDSFSFLIALIPPISLSTYLEPFDILSIVLIFQIGILSGGIEYIHSETELVFAISWRGAECITTLSEIPHPLLVCSTSVCGDHRQWDTESFFEIESHDRE